MGHPIVAAVADVRAVLKGVAGANPTFLSVEDKAVALTELVGAEGQLAELRLRVLADADDLAQSSGAKDAAGWLAHHTRTRHADAVPGWGPAPGWGQSFPGWSPLVDHGSLPLRAANALARWWWPILTLAGFATVTGLVLDHDHPTPGLSTRGLVTIALAALVMTAGTVVTEMNTPLSPPTLEEVNERTPAAAAITATIKDHTLGW